MPHIVQHQRITIPHILRHGQRTLNGRHAIPIVRTPIASLGAAKRVGILGQLSARVAPVPRPAHRQRADRMGAPVGILQHPAIDPFDSLERRSGSIAVGTPQRYERVDQFPPVVRLAAVVPIAEVRAADPSPGRVADERDSSRGFRIRGGGIVVGVGEEGRSAGRPQRIIVHLGGSAHLEDAAGIVSKILIAIDDVVGKVGYVKLGIFRLFHFGCTLRLFC
mmetsp:Transcript_42947/g.90207  ORF Transcript_42947/g.90207 Transcript_42947/m.90207 type:complete len:221 (-) Transcript_42947:557-1219(-)